MTPLIKETELFLDDKPAIYGLRQNSRAILKKTGFPTHKTEAWKYTDISPIIKNDFILNKTIEEECHCCTHSTTDDSYISVKFCNGSLHVEEFNTPEGLTITPLPIYLFEDDYKPYLFKSFDIEKHPFAALNGIYIEQGLFIHIEENIKIEKPIKIIYNQTHSENNQIHLHNVIVMEKNSELDLFEQFNSETNNKYLFNIVNEFYLKSDAILHHYKIQKESRNAYHIALNSAKLQNNSKYLQYYLANGSKICRNETLVNLDKKDAEAKVFSAYIAKKDCVNDITTNINHNCPQTYSNQYAKAVLEGKSTATFQGKIHIARDAIQTTGYQLHKALYLENDAQLNCKPELEIYADDVKCSHGATCGEVDKEQMFYLLSRGINKKDALNMLIKAHLEEVIDNLPNSKIKEIFLSCLND